jgi:hypothetical protein
MDDVHPHLALGVHFARIAGRNSIIMRDPVYLDRPRGIGIQVIDEGFFPNSFCVEIVLRLLLDRLF